MKVKSNGLQVQVLDTNRADIWSGRLLSRYGLLSALILGAAAGSFRWSARLTELQSIGAGALSLSMLSALTALLLGKIAPYRLSAEDHKIIDLFARRANAQPEGYKVPPLLLPMIRTFPDNRLRDLAVENYLELLKDGLWQETLEHMLGHFVRWPRLSAEAAQLLPYGVPRDWPDTEHHAIPGYNVALELDWNKDFFDALYSRACPLSVWSFLQGLVVNKSAQLSLYFKADEIQKAAPMMAEESQKEPLKSVLAGVTSLDCRYASAKELIKGLGTALTWIPNCTSVDVKGVALSAKQISAIQSICGSRQLLNATTTRLPVSTLYLRSCLSVGWRYLIA